MADHWYLLQSYIHHHSQVAAACECGILCGCACIDGRDGNHSKYMISYAGTGMNTPFPHSVASSLVDLDMWMIVYPQYTVFWNDLIPLGSYALLPAKV